MPRKKKMCDEAWTLTMATLSIPRMEVMLVAGAHPPGRPTDCKYAGRAWDTVTERLIDAVLFAFNQEWSGVAWGAAHHVRHGLGEEWVPFIMRVLVEGIPDSPSAVTPCWTLEGSEPVEVQYPWDRKEQ